MLTGPSSDAQNLHFVYDWRQEQERTLRAAKGTGMTEEQVTNFVNGCMTPFVCLIREERTTDVSRLSLLRIIHGNSPARRFQTNPSRHDGQRTLVGLGRATAAFDRQSEQESSRRYPDLKYVIDCIYDRHANT